MNYPNKKNTFSKKVITYGNRGMSLEYDINNSNNYYLENDIAVIHKKPTPVKVINLNYKTNRIDEAYYEVPSTTDYNGIYKGKYIDFDAKETSSKTSFPINNIHKHQIDHLIKVKNHGGISFLIIRFNSLNETYLFETKFLEDFINNNERKSIPYNYIKDNGYLIEESYYPRIKYIEILDKIL